ESLTGWVILNGQTIGSATSGASQRANSDTQNLFVYLWTNCASPSSNNHCTVVGGLGASALADFQANKKLTLPDLRDRDLAGRDCMGNTCAGGLLTSNILSGGSDTPDTAAAWGGVANQQTSVTLSQANLPNLNFPVSGIALNNGAVSATSNISVGTGSDAPSINGIMVSNTSAATNISLTGSS